MVTSEELPEFGGFCPLVCFLLSDADAPLVVLVQKVTPNV